MPIQPCEAEGKPGYRWGKEGTCYTYTAGDEVGRRDAHAEAVAQARAIIANQEKQALRRAFVVTSNAYIDRDDEIIKEKALKRYVESCWKGEAFVGTNPLLWWHGGEPIGRILFADMVGPFLLEVFEELPDTVINLAGEGEPPFTASVREVWDGLEGRTDLGASHEFDYKSGDQEDGVYEMIIKTETSVLPRDSAANAYTLFEVLTE